MKHQWLAYVIVALLSIGAGVAIAGMPNNVSVDATIIPPTTTEAPAPTVPTTTVPPTPDTTEPETTEPPESTTATPDTTDPDAAELPERDELNVGAANGAGIADTAARAVTRLEAIGYVDVSTFDGTEIVEFTTIYHADGFEDAALCLAEDLDLLPEFVAPLAEAPTVGGLPETIELLAYIGIDRAR